MKNKKHLGWIALGAAAALTLSACASDGDGDGNGAGAGDDNGSGGGPITIAVFNGWDEGIAVSELWKAVLEDEGYDVTLQYVDPGPAYAGLAEGDYDLILDSWLPLTHADYIDEFGDRMVDLGSWNDEAALTIAVNADAPITSLEELSDHADTFGGEIVGIESGAGLTRVTNEDVIPGYGLDDFTLIESSTPAMLAELDGAMAADRDIVVTLWRPHWAYNAYDIRDLEDPQGLLGDAESIHSFASEGFVEAHPQVVTWIENFEMPSDLLYSLEDVMFNEYDGSDYGPIVADWMAEHPEFVSGLTAE